MATAPTSPAKKPHPHRDNLREVVETIVFVVALVLMLKLFVVEAFVIPTGSMAETLLGYNKLLTCPECGHEFPVNVSNEVDPPDGIPKPLTGATCPNCRNLFQLESAVSSESGRGGPKHVARDPGYRSGDRVLVHKALYTLGEPDRGDVVVFKFPVDPQVKHTAQNYIKRLWGLGDETLAIWRGDLYIATGLTFPEHDKSPSGDPTYSRPEDWRKLWEGPDVNRHSKTDPPYRSLGLDFTYHNTEKALAAFEASRRTGFPGGPGMFRLLRKSDALVLSMRRLVYDNEHQSGYLAKQGVPARWQAPEGGWKSDTAATPRSFTHTGDAVAWLRYTHRISNRPTPADQRHPEDFAEWDDQGRPRIFVNDWAKVGLGFDEAQKQFPAGVFPASPITNFLGYNAGIESGSQYRLEASDHWVGDLLLECTATVAGPGDEVVLELSKGVNRFQARFTGGKVALVRAGPGGKELASAATRITSSGNYELRFANVDCKLRVWVNGSAIDFGTAAEYAPTDVIAFENSLGALAGAGLAPRANGMTLANDLIAPASIGGRGAVTIGQMKLWKDTFFTPAQNRSYEDPDDPVDTFYVQPGHYLCLGDNSGQSSDSRKWGLVPERLLLGKACFVFWPFDVFRPFSLDGNRIGFIR